MYQSFVETVQTCIVMITRPLALVIVCFGVLILLQSLVPKVRALKRSSKENEFMLEDQRTRKRKNYVIRMDRDSDVLGNTGNVGTSYYNEPSQSDANPEDLSAFIVDYANMIRNDVILLDNSVETRTQKRGNIKVKKFNQAIPDPPCNCEYFNDTVNFGENSYPQFVETRNCSRVQHYCLPPFVCQENVYYVPIIRKRESVHEDSLKLPGELKYKWVAEKRAISVGCVCVRDYIEKIE